MWWRMAQDLDMIIVVMSKSIQAKEKQMDTNFKCYVCSTSVGEGSKGALTILCVQCRLNREAVRTLQEMEGSMFDEVEALREFVYDLAAASAAPSDRSSNADKWVEFHERAISLLRAIAKAKGESK